MWRRVSPLEMTMSTIREPSDRLAPVYDEEPSVWLHGRKPIAVNASLVRDESTLTATDIDCGVTESIAAGRICSASAARSVDATVAEAILDILEREGVKYLFGIPG